MRLRTPQVKIGEIKIGGNSKIAIQTMTNTDTKDAAKTAKQCMELFDGGAEIVRITVDNENSAKAVPEIRKILNKKGYKNLPLIGDFHFNGHLLLEKHPKCAETLDKYRINPGNIGKDENFEKIIKIAKKFKKPVRIGINSGSIGKNIPKNKIIPELVKIALSSAKNAEKLGLKRNQIILSIKISDVQEVIKANELLAKKMGENKRIYAIHVGLTEAGSNLQGIISSTSALSILLNQGIGDTIRVSITPAPNEPRTKEVEICKEILQSLDLRHFKPHITSCPGCGRTNNKLFQEMNQKISANIEKNFPKWEKTFPEIKNLKIAIMGCVVNGPGESKNADIAIHLPGKTEKPLAQVYIDGKFHENISGKNIPEKFISILQKYIKKHGNLPR